MRRVLVSVLTLVLAAGQAHSFQPVRFESEWGATADGPFHGPSGIAFDSAGNLFVADAGNHRVAMVTIEGEVLRSFGGRGDKPGQFEHPAGIAIDSEGMIYVADTGNDRIQVLDPNGAPLYVFGSEGTHPKEFKKPRGLAVFSDLLFVTDSGNHRVQVFSRDGVFLHSFGDERTLRKPVDVAIGADGRVLVADEDGNRIQLFSFEGELKRTLSAPSDAPENLLRPVALELDERGFLFVADSGNVKAKKFDPSYKVVASVGSRGKVAPGAFIEMAGVAVGPTGRVFVSDSAKNTIQAFSMEKDGRPPVARMIRPFGVELQTVQPGRILDRVMLGEGSEAILEEKSRKARITSGDGSRVDLGPFDEPVSLGVDGSGNLWVVDSGAHQLLEFSRDGARLLVLGKKGSTAGYLDTPRSVAFASNGNVYVADTGNHRVQIFTPEGLLVGGFGHEGESPGELRDPVALALDDANNVYVSEESNSRVSRYTEKGKFLGVIGGRGRADGQFEKPGALTWSPSGRLMVYDQALRRIQMFTAEGEFITKFGSPAEDSGPLGFGHGEFARVTALRSLSPTRLLVMDTERSDTQEIRIRFTPAAPSRVSAKGALKAIDLKWESGREPYFETFRVYRRDSSHAPMQMAASTGENSWTDADVLKDRMYEYAVTAVAKDGFESPLSKISSASPLKLIPKAPSGLKLEPRELAMVISWQPNPEKFIDYYTLYRGETPVGDYREVARQPSTVVFDPRLVEDRVYYYRVTATARDGEEGPSGTVVFDRPLRSPVSKPPIQIAHIELRPIYAARYASYESEPLGRITIRNNTDLPISNVRLGVALREKEYAPAAVQITLAEIGPLASEDRDIVLAFNPRLLELNGNATFRVDFSLSYFEGRMERTVTDSYPFAVFDKDVEAPAPGQGVSETEGGPKAD